MVRVSAIPMREPWYEKISLSRYQSGIVGLALCVLKCILIELLPDGNTGLIKGSLGVLLVIRYKTSEAWTIIDLTVVWV